MKVHRVIIALMPLISSCFLLPMDETEYQLAKLNIDLTEAPVLAGPTSGAQIDKNSALSWQAVEWASTYTLQISYSSSFDIISLEVPELESTSFTIGDSLPDFSTYHWRVQACSSGFRGSWSNQASFSINPLSAPIPVGPANDALLDMGSMLTWQEVPLASSYTLQISSTDSFSSTILTVNSINATSYSIGDSLIIGSHYYWRVKARSSLYESTWSSTRTFTVTLNYWVSGLGTISDAEMDPVETVIYFIDRTEKKLYSYNYETDLLIERIFDNSPEHLFLHGGKLYVTLLVSGHSSYSDTESGQIAVVTASDLVVEQTVDITIDPYDIAIDDSGNLYIPSGSGQWTDIHVYDNDFALITSARIRQRCPIVYNPVLNRVYTVTTDSSPSDIKGWYLTESLTLSGKDSPYHGGYSMGRLNYASPDGLLLFNGSGNIFTCSATTDNDLRYYGTLGRSFRSLAFDTENDRFYLAGNDKTIYSYELSTRTQVATSGPSRDIDFLFYRNGHLIYFFKTSSGVSYLTGMDAF